MTPFRNAAKAHSGLIEWGEWGRHAGGRDH